MDELKSGPPTIGGGRGVHGPLTFLQNMQLKFFNNRFNSL